MRSLIIEDDLTSRKLLQGLLEPLGFTELATDGIAGVKAFNRATEEGQPFDLICLDIMMPGMDGITVLHTIRQSEITSGVPEEKRTKVVVTSALAERAKVMSAINSKCDIYILKPLNKADLLARIEALGLKGDSE